MSMFSPVVCGMVIWSSPFWSTQEISLCVCLPGIFALHPAQWWHIDYSTVIQYIKTAITKNIAFSMALSAEAKLTWCECVAFVCLFFQQSSLQRFFFFLSRFVFCNSDSLEINFRCEVPPMLVLLLDFSSSGRSSLKLPLPYWECGDLAWEHFFALQTCSSQYFF